MKAKIFGYQLVLVLSPVLSEKDGVLDKVKKQLEEVGLKTVKKDSMGLKDLVYPIKKQMKGDFYKYDLESEKAVKLNDLNLFLNREANIIRYLILKQPVG